MGFMLSAIVFAAAGIWILVFVFVLALCRNAKAGDEALDIACGRSGVRDREGEGVVIELAVSQRDRDVRQLPRLA
jgi:hypothetical protein